MLRPAMSLPLDERVEVGVVYKDTPFLMNVGSERLRFDSVVTSALDHGVFIDNLQFSSPGWLRRAPGDAEPAVVGQPGSDRRGSDALQEHVVRRHDARDELTSRRRGVEGAYSPGVAARYSHRFDQHQRQLGSIRRGRRVHSHAVYQLGADVGSGSHACVVRARYLVHLRGEQRRRAERACVQPGVAVDASGDARLEPLGHLSARRARVLHRRNDDLCERHERQDPRDPVADTMRNDNDADA